MLEENGIDRNKEEEELIEIRKTGIDRNEEEKELIEIRGRRNRQK